MVSAEEKRKFIEQMIRKENMSMANEDIKRQLYEMLNKDTHGGKLYKYRTFDKEEYSLKNLKDGTLHCSKPSVFNDPFDCKIGMTFQGLLDAKFGAGIESIKTILEKFCLVVRDEAEIEKCNAEEQRIMEELLADEKVMGFVKDIGCKDKAVEEREEILMQNIPVITKTLQSLCKDEVLKKELIEGENTIESFMKNITLDKLLLFSDENVTWVDYASANGIMDDTDEIGYAMLVGESLFPELSKNINEMKQVFDTINPKMSQMIDDLISVGCLCTDVKNRLMWSHYADSHRGFCIEYDFSENIEGDLQELLLPVVYTQHRPLIPWESILDNNKENMQKVRMQILLSLMTKDSVWEYENEWRILVKATESSEYKMPKISCVYLGAAISEENLIKILKIAEELQIPVKQMKVDRGIYDLHAENVMI